MSIYSETKIFLIFVLTGLVFAFVFDFFRGLRKYKTPNMFWLYFQDVLYFITIGIILLIIMIKYLNTGIRLYNFLGIAIGIAIYIGIFGNKVRNIFSNLFTLNHNILRFILLPLEIIFSIFSKPLNKFKKFVIKCCKNFSYMVNFKYIKSKIDGLRNIKQKRLAKYDKKRKFK